MPAQEKMQALLEALVRAGPERGLQLTAYLDGAVVVDAWAGTADVASGRPVTPETLFPVFSVTKAVAATLIHRLVERGRLAYDTPVAAVWPDFARHGKDRITLRHVLAHEAGLPLIPAGLGYADICNWNRICAALADARPIAAPGSVMIYHAATFGWILGEMARRATGQSFPQLLEKEIKEPLGLADFHVGIPDAAESRVATAYEDPTPGAPPPDDPGPRDIPGWMWPLGGMMNRPDVRRACMPAVNGIMNSRSLAKFYAGLLPGGLGGVELLSSARIREATRQETFQHLPNLEAPRRMGLGYFLGGKGSPEMSLRLDAFGHGGHGAALGYADPGCRLAVGFAKNFLSPTEPIRVNLMRALRAALGLPET